MLYKAEHAVARLIAGGKDQAHKTSIKQLVCGLRLDINMEGKTVMCGCEWYQPMTLLLVDVNSGVTLMPK